MIPRARVRRRPVALALVVALAATAAPGGRLAHAQPKKPSAPASGPKAEDRAVKDAQARFEEGLRRYKAQDFEGARLAFLQAYTAYPSVDILWNLCLAELRAGKSLDALRHLKQYEKDPKLTEAERSKAQKYVDEARAKTGHAKVLAPQGALLSLDGAALGEAPLGDEVDFEPGKRVFEAKIDADTERQEVSVEAGQTVDVRFAPRKATEPVAKAEPAPSPWKSPDEGSPGVGRTVTAVALGGAGVVALGVGLALRLSANDSASEAEGLRRGDTSSCLNDVTDRCTRLRDLSDSSVSQGNVSNVLLVGGGALVVGAVVTWLVWPSSKGEPARAGTAPGPRLRAGGVELVPVVSPTSAGFVGRF